MNFGEAIKSGFHNYVTFSGRAARSEYWFWHLFFILVAVAAALIDLALFPQSSTSPLNNIAELILLLPTLAVSVRRLHDLDRSGWWIFLGLIPLIGAIWLLVWFCMRGTVGPNRFGPDPLPGGAVVATPA
jgi:uncharacterized membrane protein YhaH (DUF805 family)